MKKRILIVDDEEGMLNSMRRDLSEFKSQYDIFTTTNGNKVPTIIENEAIDMLITDVLMPDKEGIELIREVKKQFPLVRIIGMSGGGKIGGIDYLSMARDLGASYVLYKPFTREELITTIEQALDT